MCTGNWADAKEEISGAWPRSHRRLVSNPDGRAAIGLRPADGSGPHRRDLEAGDVRIPQALERDVVAVLAMHAGDAGIFAEAGAPVGRDIERIHFGLTGPGDDPAGVIALDVRVGLR